MNVSSSQKWVDNYFEVFYDPEGSLDQEEETTLSTILDLSPVNSDEITDLISELKTGKAPGLDGILDELLKSYAGCWAAPPPDLFTLIDHNG